MPNGVIQAVGCLDRATRHARAGSVRVSLSHVLRDEPVDLDVLLAELLPEQSWALSVCGGGVLWVQEVVDVDDEEQGGGGGDHVGVVVFDGGLEVEFAAVAGVDVGAQGVGGVEQDGGEVVDSEVAGDGEFSHAVEQESEQVVEDGGDRAAVGDRGGADVAGVEAVVGVDTVCVAAGAQVVAVWVGRSAAEAVVVVGREVGGVGCDHWKGRDPVLAPEGFGSGFVCAGAGCVLGHGRFLRGCVATGWW